MIKNQHSDSLTNSLQPGLFAINGQPQPHPWSVPVTDSGFMYGQCALETLSGFIVDGKDCIPLLDQHLARLENSCENLGFKLPAPIDRLAIMVRMLMTASGLERTMIRIYATPGSAVTTGFPTEPVWYALLTPAGPDWIDKMRLLTTSGLSLAPTELGFTRRQNSVKSTAYGPTNAALITARRQGFDDLLWINQDREMVESSTANIFFIARHGDSVEIVTPSARSGCLPGITASWLMELLREAKIPAGTAILQLDELPRFDEAFLTSSLRGLVPVTRIGRHKLHSCREGSTYQHIKRLFDAGAARAAGTPFDWISGKKINAGER